mmetsp:Transcript_17466/g.29392  ORF Transcript_17466/g.29392 Transcript_17466/m.29392 type:complete len:262 (-) Transcript_17466:44-829(-)
MDLTEKSEIRKEDVPRLKKVLQDVEEDPKSYEFREPVPWKELGLTDYPEIIKKPMDIKTVRKSLVKGKYKRYEDFYRDLQLIWDNCKTYNIQGSDIYKMAEYMEKVSKRASNRSKEDLGIPFGSGSLNKEKKKKADKKAKKEMDDDDPMAEKSDDSGSEKSGSGSDAEEDDEVPFEQKVQFTEKVRRLTNEGLTKLVKMVKSLCPDALEDVDDEKLHIQVDKLDKKSFLKLEQLVEENLQKKKGNANGHSEEPNRKRIKAE